MCRPVYLPCTVHRPDQAFYNCQTHKRLKRTLIYCDTVILFFFFFFFFLQLQQTAHHVQTTSARKLQALVYDILPSTTAVFRYAIWFRNCQLTSSFLLALKQ